MIVDLMEDQSLRSYRPFCEVRPAGLNKTLSYATGKGIKIGILDSGWDRCLNDRRVSAGIGLVNPVDELLLKLSSDDGDRNGHGTSCADLILRIAPDSTIYPIRVFGRRIETSTNILVEGIKWAMEKDLKILNLSLSTTIVDSLDPIYKVCELARRKGIIIVASKPNAAEWGYPAIFENVIGVERGEFGNIFEYSFNGAEAIECKATGMFDDLCTLKGARIRSSGNSFAAPVITGIIALITETHPQLDLDAVRVFLRDLSSNCTTNATNSDHREGIARQTDGWRLML